MSEDRLIDAAEVARRLGVAPSWVASAARANRIPHHRLGRYVRFKWTEIEAWLEEEARRRSRRRAA